MLANSMTFRQKCGAQRIRAFAFVLTCRIIDHLRLNSRTFNEKSVMSEQNPKEQSASHVAENQLIADRRAKLDKLKAAGIFPFGRRATDLQTAATIRALHKPEFAQDGGPLCKVAGRIVLKRDMGKLSFLSIRDETGDIQIALDRKRVNDTDWLVRDHLDLGDIIVAQGKLGATKTGEVTIWATDLELSSKSLLPPPAKYEGLSDVEARYRHRYVDLWANPQVMHTMKLRMRIIEEMRGFMKARGFVEVETPMLQAIHGGAAARPFKTHHNALDMPLFLRIAPELFLKRLLVGGMSKVFEINRNFRNEGISPRHNPEFTMLEAYEAFGNWQTMSELVEDMICTIAQNVFGSLKIEHKNDAGEVVRTIDLSNRPWPRKSMAELVEEKTGWAFDKQAIPPALLEDIRAKNKGKDIKQHAVPAEQLTELYEKLVEPTLIDPCFVTRVPGVVIPLARRCEDDDYFADVYELAINGQEISPGYTELNDPDIQAEHFHHQVGDREEQQQTDEDFLTALRYGMPPAGGIGLGVDRLVMLLTGSASIRDVILFPLMRGVE
jgi:lysyl-tRNA synthetase, class II